MQEKMWKKVAHELQGSYWKLGKL